MLLHSAHQTSMTLPGGGWRSEPVHPGCEAPLRSGRDSYRTKLVSSGTRRPLQPQPGAGSRSGPPGGRLSSLRVGAAPTVRGAAGWIRKPEETRPDRPL
ncbi:hypothetical protein EYF80_058622 [Liparis tanakae]|uniref:Uncharacterized protein n=1 Tax=Liparis tanakae TaxID=230148 RepID=A0A4Z2ES88_9TELE|nr:hypothetical protein EYF80_058622 [Liparis tanakae]